MVIKSILSLNDIYNVNPQQIKLTYIGLTYDKYIHFPQGNVC